MIIRNATVLSFPDQSRRSGVDGRAVVRQGSLVNIDLGEVFAKSVEIVSRITNRDYDGPLQRY